MNLKTLATLALMAGLLAAAGAYAQNESVQPAPDSNPQGTGLHSVYNPNRLIPNERSTPHPSRLPPLGHDEGTTLRNPPPPPPPADSNPQADSNPRE